MANFIETHCEIIRRADLSSWVIAVDFDGTCVTHEFPDVGCVVAGAEDVLAALADAGARLILWTMRGGEYLDAAVEWFNLREITLFGINSNPEQSSWTTSPKAYGQIYIDDAALGCPLVHGEHSRPFVDWAEVASLLSAKVIANREVETIHNAAV